MFKFKLVFSFYKYKSLFVNVFLESCELFQGVCILYISDSVSLSEAARPRGIYKTPETVNQSQRRLPAVTRFIKFIMQ